MAEGRKVLVLAPHSDDETLGCGATIAKHANRGDDVRVCILTAIDFDHPVLKPNKEDIRRETYEAMSILGLGRERVIFKDLPNLLLPDMPLHEVNRVVSEVIFEVKPEILYIPFMYDLHQDHRSVAYAAQVAARTCTEVGRNIREIYMYETLSETHWNAAQLEGGFQPNVYNDVTGFMKLKLDAVRAYKSQLKEFPNVRCVEALESLAILRGGIAGMLEAEAFVLLRKLS